MRFPGWVLLAASLPLASAAVEIPPLQHAPLGDFHLESGAVIRDFQIAYRTFGKLNEAKSNAILFPTWFTGHTQDLAGLIAPGALTDSSRYFVIAVDAIGNGNTSAPSNSRAQPRMQFPRFTIRDMVNSQHRLLTQVLHIDHLRAVMGISMGGMQTFQWAVAYPTFMDKCVPIVGSPALTSYDLLLWQGELNAIVENRDWKDGNYENMPPLKALADMHTLALTTPLNRSHTVPRKDFPEALAKLEAAGPDRFDASDWVRQLEAMMSLNVAAPFGDSMERAAAVVKAKFLVVVATQDHMVNPEPAVAFAKLLHATVVELEGDCGHLSPGCEMPKLVSEAGRFLDE